ncbi:hypothetical protein VTO42DRAFT_2457 [Malbranchea cinnamomea]
MSELDRAWSEASGLEGDDTSTPSPDQLMMRGQIDGHHELLDAQLDDENWHSIEPESAGTLLRQDTVKPHDRRNNTSTSRSTSTSTRRGPPGTQTELEFSRSVRWAPWNISIERRLQTLTVLCHTLSISIFLTTFFFACAIPLFWPLLLPYLIYISLFSKSARDGTLSQRSRLLRSLPVWSYFAAYFPARLSRSTTLPPTRKYIFGYHPHGIISHGAFAAFATEALGFSNLFPGITNTLLTLDSNFRLPFYRDYALAMGLASVSRESCENILSKGGHDGAGMGRAITIVVGGARESLDARPGVMRLILKRRRGFIRLAIRTGADLVPVMAFGENDLYEQISGDGHPIIRRMQMLVKNVAGFTIPLFHARGVFNYDVGLLPYRRPIHVVVGRPICVVQKKDGSAEEIERYVDELQEEYIKELRRLFESGKEKYGAEHVRMEIIG